MCPSSEARRNISNAAMSSLRSMHGSAPPRYGEHGRRRDLAAWKRSDAMRRTSSLPLSLGKWEARPRDPGRATWGTFRRPSCLHRASRPRRSIRPKKSAARGPCAWQSELVLSLGTCGPRSHEAATGAHFMGFMDFVFAVALASASSIWCLCCILSVASCACAPFAVLWIAGVERAGRRRDELAAET